jgi:predicted transposase YbfD/YdcC
MESNTSDPKREADTQPTDVVFDVSSLYAYLLKLNDRRKRRGIRYNLATILVVLILAKLCGQDKPYAIADWAQNRRAFLVEALGLKRSRLPHHSTYRRILETGLDGDEFEGVMSAFIAQRPEVGQAVVIVIDGKTLRGTITREDPFGLHLLAAYLPGEGLVLLQMVVEADKENEIVVAPQLLRCLDLRQKVVVADAMHTQRQLSLQIVKAGGDYVWIVKDNQPATRQAIEQLFAPEKPVAGLGCPPMDFQQAKTVNKAHGRLEERTLTVSSLLNDYLDWPEVAQVFQLERRFTDLATGKVDQEVRYGLTSLTRTEASPKRLLEIVRSEWGIENGLHYRRDVTFHEDRTRMSCKPMARAMATINNAVSNLLAIQGYRNFAQARRYFDARPLQALAIIFGL